MKNTLRSCVACLLVLSGMPALAMYRCGNVYQDKPCESGSQVNLSPSGRPQSGPAATPLPRGAPAPNSASFAIICSRVGEQAQRITWKREAGATQEQQLAERATVLSPEDQAKTVASVYARRGSAPDIRAAIEAECMADKAKEAEAAEQLRQLRRQAGEGAPAPAAPAAEAAPARAPDSARVSTGNKPSASYCSSLRKSLDDARARLAQGGSSRQMEMLQTERRSAEASLRSSGCG